MCITSFLNNGGGYGHAILQMKTNKIMYIFQGYSAESGLKSRMKHFESRPSFMFAFLFFLIEV